MNFKGDKNPKHTFLRRRSKAVNTIYDFMACKRSLGKFEEKYFTRPNL
jgi:hypothetical protein